MYVLFNVDTTRYVRILRNGYMQDAKFELESAAKACATRLEAKGELVLEDTCCLEESDFLANFEKTVMVKSLMTGEQVEQSVNTPLSCDVSRETYWSM